MPPLSTACAIVRSRYLEESDHVAEIAKTRTKMDLEIAFITFGDDCGRSRSATNRARDALRSPQLQNAVLVIGGHTDAKGADNIIRIYRSDGRRRLRIIWSRRSSFPRII